MNEDFRIFLATIWGEAAGASTAAHRAIASVIMNRVGVLEWRRMETPRAVIERSGFDAFRIRNFPYREAAARFLIPSDLLPPKFRGLEFAVRAIYERTEPPVTSAVLYYSPKAQAALHAQDPKHYRIEPPWDFAKLKEVRPPDLLPSDDFRFFEYRKAIA